ncbi:hypothetical protein RGQ29_021280 [Quercus rubra]|uniref:Uncharacterized protein n=1 Tax=Quercus rubra TaxID=3512 RepID=A0AAN7FI61_QUERU|nr:hypothetical protein RGQ29_021280 [Quercus rubra]
MWMGLYFIFVLLQDSDLVVQFCKDVESRSQKVDIAIPEVFVGRLLGSMLIFLFSA